MKTTTVINFTASTFLTLIISLPVSANESTNNLGVGLQALVKAAEVLDGFRPLNKSARTSDASFKQLFCSNHRELKTELSQTLTKLDRARPIIYQKDIQPAMQDWAKDAVKKYLEILDGVRNVNAALLKINACATGPLASVELNAFNALADDAQSILNQIENESEHTEDLIRSVTANYKNAKFNCVTNVDKDGRIDQSEFTLSPQSTVFLYPVSNLGGLRDISQLNELETTMLSMIQKFPTNYWLEIVQSLEGKVVITSYKRVLVPSRNNLVKREETVIYRSEGQSPQSFTAKYDHYNAGGEVTAVSSVKCVRR